MTACAAILEFLHFAIPYNKNIFPFAWGTTKFLSYDSTHDANKKKSQHKHKPQENPGLIAIQMIQRVYAWQNSWYISSKNESF